MSLKKIYLTGVKPTFHPHIGNYVGAIRPAVLRSQSTEVEGFYFVADYHALNSTQDAQLLKQYVLDVAAVWIALGFNHQAHHLYLQSDVPEILEMATILACFTSKGLMNRAHSYKAAVDKNLQKEKDPDHGINMGLYNYPILMAADILTFRTDVVPVGPDQIQHIEMTRDIGQCFNAHYQKEVFKLPEALMNKEFGLLPGLDGRKMSKSYDNTIPLFDPEKKLQKMINRIPTDSLPPEAPKNPDDSNIFLIYRHFSTPAELNELRAKYQHGISWGEAKALLFQVVNRELANAREKYQYLISHPDEIKHILSLGAKKVRPKAQAFLQEVKATIGL
jgi:tryptophanyl-tRNA synthetase